MPRSNTLEPRKCDWCKAEFQPQTNWQRFDTVTCRNRAASAEHQKAVKLFREQVGSNK